MSILFALTDPSSHSLCLTKEPIATKGQIPKPPFHTTVSNKDGLEELPVEVEFEKVVVKEGAVTTTTIVEKKFEDSDWFKRQTPEHQARLIQNGQNLKKLFESLGPNDSLTFTRVQ